MNKKLTNTQKICITAIGVALFITLSMCLRVPVFQNYYLCLGYIVMAVWLYSVGTISGTIVGTLGTILYCFLINGLRGMPGWAIGNIVIGIMLGLCFSIIKKTTHKLPICINYIIAGIIIIISTAIGILIIKSLVEVILYAQPMSVRIITNMNAFIADSVVLIISLPICQYINKILTKQNLLSKEI